MSDTIPATLSLPFDTPRKYSNHRLQTLSCKESLIVLSLYCIQCLSVSTWVSHLESWLLVCDMQHLWPAPERQSAFILPAPQHRLPSLTDVKLLILKVDINIVTFTFYRIHRLTFKDTHSYFLFQENDHIMRYHEVAVQCSVGGLWVFLAFSCSSSSASLSLSDCGRRMCKSVPGLAAMMRPVFLASLANHSLDLQ